MSSLDVLVWIVFPYAAVTVFVVGHILRHRYDQFGWTSRSSQSYESKLLRWGSPLFHFGILAVFGGHVIGLLIPREWLEFIGITEHLYHVGATWLGTLAAAATIAGMAILLTRRGTIRRIAMVTTRMDVLMYALLAGTIIFGTVATILHQVLGPGYDYRGSIAPWVRSLIMFQPDATLMNGVPFFFQLHVLSAVALFLIWPFTRLVHVLSVPLGYFFRPYIVYRSGDRRIGARKVRPGWKRSELPVTRRQRAHHDN